MIKPDSNIRDTVSMVESRPKADINLPLPLAMFCTSLILLLLGIMLSAIVKTLF